MESAPFRHVYGPVSSRRLGRSLGVDLIPLKTCTYDCIYCQLGRTTRKTFDRAEYVPLDEVLEEIDRKLAEEPELDYISLAGSGEPTLHSRIGELIRKIKQRTTVPIAVFTNGSLLWMPEVREELMAADLVLPSLDAGAESIFRYVNRPHKKVRFDTMVEGLELFAKEFKGEMWLEVFLVAGSTGMASEVLRIGELVRRIHPLRLQINTATRPTAEDFAFAVSADQMHEFAADLERCVPGHIEVIADTPPCTAAAPIDREATDEEIVALVGRHPCTVADVSTALRIDRSEATARLERLSAEKRVERVLQNGRCYHVKV